MTSPLLEMPCFALYAASRAVSQAYRAVLAQEDITYPQFLVLVVLASEGESSVSALASAMFLDSGTLSPLLQRLEARQILTRERRKGDERTVIVALTPEGLRLHGRVTGAVDCLVPAYGISTVDELHGLLDSLHAITAGMSELTGIVRSSSRSELVG
ncbi:MarR family winged helix-turn-helix transcriptional regulator [Cryobacterium zhongshanensis]|uniref:MarR family transcriptional regulator n=1 Tax=Cryobacterium zhongshanensis TaxID=2928153 RepID=A0AA41UH76_9MICO|nr:MarR family transcriptional regulator [Cryobacterium zhongshanensis]MCI4658104.1 MarR family transcriptional regulator [Cryobacterium zhongshanensis]